MTDSQTISPSQECITVPISIALSALCFGSKSIAPKCWVYLPKTCAGGPKDCWKPPRPMAKKISLARARILRRGLRILLTTTVTKTTPVRTGGGTTSTERHYRVVGRAFAVLIPGRRRFSGGGNLRCGKASLAQGSFESHDSPPAPHQKKRIESQSPTRDEGNLCLLQFA